MTLRQRHQPSAFTLLEVLLALAAFAILSVTVIAVFMSSGREERRGLARQREVGSAQFLLEQMARDIRLGSPNYQYYSDRGDTLATGLVVNPVNRLAIAFADNSHRYYGCWKIYQLYINGTPDPNTKRGVSCEQPTPADPAPPIVIYKSSSVIISSDTADETCTLNFLLAPPACDHLPDAWLAASLENALIQDFRVYLTPAEDPFSASATDLRQPLTTVALTIEGIGRSEEQVRTTFQTTASSRYYAR